MDRQERLVLNYQAMQIEYTLAANKVRAHVYHVQAGGRVNSFHFRLLAPARVSAVQRLADEIALALGADACRLVRIGAGFVAEVESGQASGVALPALLRQIRLAGGAVPGAAVLGLSAEDGSIVQIRLGSPDVTHVLIAGTTGSGKTVLARTILASLMASTPARELRVALVDPKARHLRPFAGYPHVVGDVATGADDWTGLILQVVAEMEDRYRREASRPALVLAVDEVADVVAADPALEGALVRIAQMGREAGIHLLLATQKPSASALSGLITSNLPARLVGRVLKHEDARIAAGVGGTEAERLSGKGDFLALAAGKRVRFQAAMVRDEDLPLIIRGTARETAPALPEDSQGLRDRVRASLRVIAGRDPGGRPSTPVPAEAVQLARSMAAADGGRWPSAWALRQAWAGLEHAAGLPRALRHEKARAAIAEAQLLADRAEQNGQAHARRAAAGM
jgi:S-DNA-T family DNA segregation ATPase FtsK/SpoIIIE